MAIGHCDWSGITNGGNDLCRLFFDPLNDLLTLDGNIIFLKCQNAPFLMIFWVWEILNWSGNISTQPITVQVDLAKAHLHLIWMFTHPWRYYITTIFLIFRCQSIQTNDSNRWPVPHCVYCLILVETNMRKANLPEGRGRKLDCSSKRAAMPFFIQEATDLSDWYTYENREGAVVTPIA